MKLYTFGILMVGIGIGMLGHNRFIKYSFNKSQQKYLNELRKKM